MSSRSNVLVWVVILISISSCTYKHTKRTSLLAPHAQKQTCYSLELFASQEVPAEDPVEHVTIFVHGTHLSLIAAERCAPSFCTFALTYFFESPRGMRSAHTQDHVFKHLAQSLSSACPHLFSLEHFYFFDWSGKLGPENRTLAAAELFEALTKLCQEPRYHNARITLIGYSHGANVAVQMSALANQRGCVPFTIDRLIMLACPVQESTQRHISSPLFKHIYHLYSPADLVQVMDTNNSLYTPGASQWGLSKRVFQAPATGLVQAKVTLNGRSLHHKDFVSQSFFQAIPAIISSLEQPLICNTLPFDKQGIYHFNLVTRPKSRNKLKELTRSFSHLALTHKKKKTLQARIDVW